MKRDYGLWGRDYVKGKEEIRNWNQQTVFATASSKMRSGSQLNENYEAI